MILYLAQVTFLWLAFSIIYYIVLSNKSIFRFNRWYLLTTLLGSLVIPLIPFGRIFSDSEIVPTFSFAENQLNELVINVSETNNSFDWTMLLKVFLIIGMIVFAIRRSEEHTSELQSRENLVCRLLLEKKKPNIR